MASSVVLGEALEAVVTRLVADGRFGSRSEVLREGVRLVLEREAALREHEAILAASFADIAAGRVRDLDEVVDELIAELRAERTKAA